MQNNETSIDNGIIINQNKETIIPIKNLNNEIFFFLKMPDFEIDIFNLIINVKKNNKFYFYLFIFS